MRKQIIASIIVVLSIGFGLSFASELPDFPFVFAEGSAVKYMAPDEAYIRFTVIEFDKESEKVFELVMEKSKEILDLCNSFKIGKQDIDAFHISKRTVRTKVDYEELEIQGYEVSREFEVKLADIDNYESFIKKLLSINNVCRIYPNFGYSEKDDLEVELSVEACQDARAEAKSMADGFNSKLGEIHAISKKGFRNIPGRFGLDDYRDPNSYITKSGNVSLEEDSTILVPEFIEFRAYVSAIFKIQSK